MASKVYLIYRGGALGGDKEIISSIEKKGNVELVPNTIVKEIQGNNTLQKIVIKDNLGLEKTIDVDGLFIEMGSKINLDFVRHLVKVNSKGEIEVTEVGKQHIQRFLQPAMQPIFCISKLWLLVAMELQLVFLHLIILKK
jgi:thioredoxin reductase (NADPH)